MELQAIEVARSAAESSGPLLFNATLIAQIIHFAILLVFLRLVVWKPLINAIDKRREKIGSDITAAEKDRSAAENLRAELNAELAKGKEEAQAIIQRATKSAEEEANQIVESAKTEATRIKENAMQDIQMEREKAVAELKNEVAGLSILVANKVVSEKITDDVQDDLVKKFIDDAGKLPC